MLRFVGVTGANQANSQVQTVEQVIDRNSDRQMNGTFLLVFCYVCVCSKLLHLYLNSTILFIEAASAQTRLSSDKKFIDITTFSFEVVQLPRPRIPRPPFPPSPDTDNSRPCELSSANSGFMCLERD